jgi:serine protease Do
MKTSHHSVHDHHVEHRSTFLAGVDDIDSADRSPRRASPFGTRRLISALAAAGLLGAVGSAGAWGLGQWFEHKPVAGNGQVVQPADSSNGSATQSPTAGTLIAPISAPNYRGIVQTYGPAVVGVIAEGTQPASADAQADPFQQFFRGMPGRRGQGPQVPFKGQGSGFIVSADGLILTNAHVVQNAKEVTVKLQDRREYRAKVLGLDSATDIAVLRIEAKNLPTVLLGDPAQLQVGDPVLAIGAPFGFEQTATQGIVSAKGRSLPGDAFVPFIQTDAAVNPGNSGGPLFDGSGRVIGINSQIYSRTGGYEGLSFAIPIDVAVQVKEQIVQHGSAQHARLGVQVQDVNQGLAESFGLERPGGALISQVVPGSAADKAGLKSGDVIVAINGQPVISAGDVSSRIGLSAPGTQVKLRVWRDKSSHDLSATLGRATEQQADAGPAADASQGQLGLALRQLSPDERRQSGIEHGLLVQDVAGPAARAGLQIGDVLLAVNGKPIDGIEQIKTELARKAKTVALLIQRGEERIFVPVNMS